MGIHDTQIFHFLRYLFISGLLLCGIGCQSADQHAADTASADDKTNNSSKPVEKSDAQAANKAQLPPGLALIDDEDSAGKEPSANQEPSAGKEPSANQEPSANYEEIRNLLVDQPQTIPPFKLHDHNGHPFSKQQLNGKWSFLVFGYTNCPDVCPTTLAEMDDFMALLPDTKLKDKTQVIFVSVDPKRDTDKELKQYLSYFNGGFIGVSGSVEDLRQFCLPLNIQFEYEQLTKDIYGVNHSSSVVLLDPKTRYVARLPVPIYAKKLLDKYRKIVQRMEKS